MATTRSGPVIPGCHFTWEELAVSHEHPELVVPVPDACAADAVRLVRTVLEPIRLHVAKPYEILSCYRSDALNDAVGGSDTSQHRRAQAGDGRPRGADRTELERLFLDLLLGQVEGCQPGQVIIYPDRGFIHAALPSRTYPVPSFHVQWPARHLAYTRVSSVSAYRSLTR